MIVTTTSLRTYRRCTREYYYRYVARYEETDTPAPLLMGRRYHLGVEQYWQRHDLNAALDAMWQPPIEPHWDSEKGQFDAAKVSAMIVGYYDAWGLAAPAETEGQVRLQLDGRIEMRGRYDAMTTDGSLVEAKTTGMDISEDSAFWSRLAFDLQTTVYAKALGAARIVYDVCRKPALRPKKGEGPREYGLRCAAELKGDTDKYYQRRSFAADREHGAEILEEARRTAERIAELGEADSPKIAYPRNDAACQSWGRLCPFFNVCAGADELDSPNYRKKRSQHEETDDGHQDHSQD